MIREDIMQSHRNYHERTHPIDLNSTETGAKNKVTHSLKSLGRPERSADTLSQQLVPGAHTTQTCHSDKSPWMGKYNFTTNIRVRPWLRAGTDGCLIEDFALSVTLDDAHLI